MGIVAKCQGGNSPVLVTVASYCKPADILKGCSQSLEAQLLIRLNATITKGPGPDTQRNLGTSVD